MIIYALIAIFADTVVQRHTYRQVDRCVSLKLISPPVVLLCPWALILNHLTAAQTAVVVMGDHNHVTPL